MAATPRRWFLLHTLALVAPARLRSVPAQTSFAGIAAGETRRIGTMLVCWCPAGRFVMGSPRDEPERRPGEDQVTVTLTQGFWMAKHETTQELWTHVMGGLPGPLTKELPAGANLPVGNVNFAEAEAFCAEVTRQSRRAGDLPADWEVRLPTEAQWEYACRAGTTTATAFGNSLSSRQANFKGTPYNGGEPGPSLGHAAPVGQLPRKCVGAARHARQHVRVVSRLVSRSVTGRHRSRLVSRARDRYAERARCHLARATRGMLGR